MTDNPEDLLLAFHTKTTQGRWTHFETTDGTRYLLGVGPVTQFYRHGNINREPDADFIVAAHEHIPALCEKMKRLEAALREIILLEPATWDCSVPHDMAQIADAALNHEQKGQDDV